MAGRMVRRRIEHGSRSGPTPRPVTTQNDQQLRYRKKRMPRRKRRRWVGFTKKVKHVMMQMQQLVSYTVKYMPNAKTWAANVQLTDGQMVGGTTASNNDELFQVFRAYYGSGFGASTVDDLKLFLKSLCVDLQISNTGSDGCILDVYYLRARKTYNTATRIDQQYSTTFLEQPTGVAGNLIGAVDPTDPATTPFQNSMFCEFWRIESKREIILGVGQTTSLQLRLPTNKKMSGKTLESNPAMIPGYTRAFLFQVRGVPIDTAGVTSLAAGQISWAAQTTVCYSIPPGVTRTTTAQV